MNFQELRDKINFGDILSEFNIQQESGGRYKCPSCPSDKTPALKVYEQKTYCHRCKRSDDIISLYGLFAGSSYLESAKTLAKKYNIGWSEEEEKKFNKEQEYIKEYEEFVHSCSDYIQKNKALMEPLFKRGLTEKFIKEYKIGFYHHSISFFGKSWVEKGIKNMRGRYIIPYYKNKKIVYLTSWLSNSEHKYINMKGGRYVLGEDDGNEPVIISEGVFDYLLAKQFKHNCIAICGGGLNPDLHIFSNNALLLFDGDEQGREYNKIYTRYLMERNVGVTVGKLEDNTDLADWLKWGKKIEDIPTEKIAKGLTVTECKAVGKYNPVKGWACTEDGMYFNKKQVATRPVLVTNIGFKWGTNEEFASVKYQDTKGRWRETIIDTGALTDSSRLIKENNRLPVTSNNKSKMVDYFYNFIANNHEKFEEFLVTSRLGWHGDEFVMPDRVLGSNGNHSKIHYLNNAFKDALKTRGDFEKWKTVVKKLFQEEKLMNQCQGARFCLYASALSVTLRDLRLEPITIHIYDTQSSVGKTSSIQLALSLYGQPKVGNGLIDTWTGTEAGIIRSMTTLNDIPKGIDELSVKGSKGVDSWLYQISGGTSKTKATQDSTNNIAEKTTFSLVVFSTGERQITKDTARTGANIRGWELGKPFGEEKISEYIEEMHKVISSNYGHAIDHLIPLYLKNKDRIKNTDFYEKHRTDNMPGHEERVLKRIGYIYNIGKLFAEEILEIDSDIVEKDCFFIAKKILSKVRVTKNDRLATIEAIKEMYEANSGMFSTVIKTLRGKSSFEWDSNYGQPEVPRGKSFWGFIFEENLYLKTKIFKEWVKEIFEGQRTEKEIKDKLTNYNDMSDCRATVEDKQMRYYVFYNIFKDDDAKAEMQKALEDEMDAKAYKNALQENIDDPF